MPLSNVSLNTDQILYMLNDVKNIQLKAVMKVGNLINISKDLPIETIMNKNYSSGKNLYLNFRKLVPKGRYGLAMGSYTDDGKKDKMMVFDTQLIKKALKKKRKQ